jgi:hypothetical protein
MDIVMQKMKHLELIQEIITRMASNSFLLKGWAVTLVVGIFSLAGKNIDKIYFLVTYVPICIFWFLDSYYLLQEKLYRVLYDYVREMDENHIDFSMNTKSPQFQTNEATFVSCLFSKTELFFYIPLATITVSIIILTYI